VSATDISPPELGDVVGLPTLSDVPETPAEPATTPAARTSHVVIRRVDPWSVLKLSLLFYLCVCLVLLVAGIVLWAGASAAGVVENVESFFQDAGFDGFEFSAGVMLRGFAIGGLILVVAGTIANLLLATLFNLMSDVVGGIRVTLGEDLRPRSR
jgi:hypothetical protein